MAFYNKQNTAFNMALQKEIEDSCEVLEKYGRKTADPAFYDAQSLEEALNLLSELKGAVVIGGGLDLIGLIRGRIQSPEALISVKNVPGLNHIISLSDDSVDIGAMTSVCKIAESRAVAANFPMLTEAAERIGSPQIRNQATLAGNLCQQTHCWYYRRSPSTGLTYDCIRNGRSGICWAEGGENEHHSIFCSGKCHSANNSDLATALLALNGKIRIHSVHGKKLVNIEQFYTNTGTVLEENEMVTGVMVPSAKEGTKQRFIKVAEREAIDVSIVSAAVAVTLADGYVVSSRIALGGVAFMPYRAVKAEDVLCGQKLTEEIAERAAAAAVSDAHPMSGNEYKVRMLQAVLKRAILE